MATRNRALWRIRKQGDRWILERRAWITWLLIGVFDTHAEAVAGVRRADRRRQADYVLAWGRRG